MVSISLALCLTNLKVGARIEPAVLMAQPERRDRAIVLIADHWVGAAWQNDLSGINRLVDKLKSHTVFFSPSQKIKKNRP